MNRLYYIYAAIPSLIVTLLFLLPVHLLAIPYLKQITAKEYNAHNQSFDIAVDRYGTVFIANFEGLLYYDGVTWRKLFTPEINRLTRVYIASDGKVYCGGPKYFGVVEADDNGRLRLRSVQPSRHHAVRLAVDTPSVMQVGNTRVSTPDGRSLLYNDGGMQYILRESDGLPDGIIANMSYDGHNTVWGATSHGLFQLDVASPYKRVGEAQGLKGEVHALGESSGTLYVGTMDGVYRIVHGVGEKIAGIEAACWRLQPHAVGGLLAVTLDGDYHITNTTAHYLGKKNDVERLFSKENVFTEARRQVAFNEQLAKHPLTRPLSLLPSINALLTMHDNTIVAGGDFGIVMCNRHTDMQRQPRALVYLREIDMADSIIWGGYKKKGLQPITQMHHITLPSDCHAMRVTFSSNRQSVITPTQYRYRINDGAWTPWTSENEVRFNNLSYGTTVLEIESIDLNGEISERASVEWYHEYPFFMRWWAWLLYIVILITAGRTLSHYRTKKLERDKRELQQTVQALSADMVRMERSATAGKLTQGLIDRILNPINYINNFSKLTKSLADDLSGDIESEKPHLSVDNYEDCKDILSMMHQNLDKITEHGSNTTRVLRAMEDVLNNNVGTPRSVSLSQLCHQAVEVSQVTHQLTITADIQPDVTATVEPVSLCKVIVSLLDNAVYAVQKKQQRGAGYTPEIRLTLRDTVMTVFDNGIGIEDSIINKVFDPFFTTKPTSDGAGIGLFLAREIIQAHGGTITIESQKDHHTTVVITVTSQPQK